MGCRKLTYYTTETTPLKVVQGKAFKSGKVVQWFIRVDPIADEFAWVSPFNYAENSPIANIDLHGLQASYYTNQLDKRFGSAEYKNKTAEQRQEERFTEGAVVAGGLAVATVAAVGGEAALPLLANPLTVETSGTIIATNVAADGMIQTVTNIANGEDPIENFDVAGSLTSALSNVVVAQALDGTFDITLDNNFVPEINNIEVALTNTVVGGVLGSASDSIVKPASEATNSLVGAAVNFISGLFTNSSKSVATDLIDE